MLVSVSKPSKIINELEENRKKKHNEAIECMRLKKRQINLEIDELIRNEAEKLKEELSQLKSDLYENMKKCREKYLSMVKDIAPDR